MTHPERTGLVEAKGALLSWDVLTGERTEDVHDEQATRSWWWELPELPDTLARLHWARAWWPASAVADVPPPHPALLAAELALATAALSHLLDDEEATERALTGLLPLPLAALADTPWQEEAVDLARRLADLAEDHGVEPPEPAPLPRPAYALAAGGQAPEDVVLQRGSGPVDWALVPPGAVDAVAEASWTVSRRNGITELAVTALPAPGSVPPRLAARFGPVDLDLDLTPDGVLTGRVPLPATALLLPAAQRVLTVYAPGFAEPGPPDPDAPARRAALVELARTRLSDPAATLAERTARTLWRRP
ncbi:hypothetical protein JOF53_005538 [Crossiella equi]|uniref:Uncharacterized protein n=1 Tax=Crossiella equi TaxID=130796 RepID=A0ABS5AJC2_9PSEU|nr:hypothetical protein [Crossiella equi]MBP2476666.1 hypothetical protein [Crossiella equi]